MYVHTHTHTHTTHCGYRSGTAPVLKCGPPLPLPSFCPPSLCLRGDEEPAGVLWGLPPSNHPHLFSLPLPVRLLTEKGLWLLERERENK